MSCDIEMRLARNIKKGDEVIGFGVLTYVSALPTESVWVWNADEERSLWPADALIPIVTPPSRTWRRTITYITASEATAEAWRVEEGKAETTTTQARVSTRVFGKVEVLDA